MSIDKERTKILNMVQDGRKTAEEGARLLAELSQGHGGVSPAPNRPPSGLMLHIRVMDVVSGRIKASVQLPLSVVDAGIKLGARFIPDIDGEDPSEYMNAVHSGMTGKIFEILDEAGGEHVEVVIQ